MTISYIEVASDSDNVDTWLQKLYSFASTLEVAKRCNAAAVAAARLERTYPSLATIEEFVQRGALIIIGQDAGVVQSYMICTDDNLPDGGKYGGCRGRWVGVGRLPPPQIPAIYAAMADVAVARYGWLWGRVSNTAIRNLMLSSIEGCELGIPKQPEIVTYKKPV